MCPTYDWDACSVNCGPGTQTRRVALTSYADSYEKCQYEYYSRDCYLGDCPVNCTLSSWSAFGACVGDCGFGVQFRDRLLFKDVNSRVPCESFQNLPLVESQPCAVPGCPIDCVVGDWGAFQDCSVSCGSGSQTRSRTVRVTAENGGLACPSPLTEFRLCYTINCPETARKAWPEVTFDLEADFNQLCGTQADREAVTLRLLRFIASKTDIRSSRVLRASLSPGSIQVSLVVDNVDFARSICAKLPGEYLFFQFSSYSAFFWLSQRCSVNDKLDPPTPPSVSQNSYGSTPPTVSQNSFGSTQPTVSQNSLLSSSSPSELLAEARDQRIL
eukprot:m.113157 g.113157  ORF g.113157 m.113157 type:complete len:329 (+) comp51861_c0_seq7:266-1252(+)